MSDDLTANKGKVKAIIGLGDLVMGSIKRVFDQVGVKAGDIPVVGWGNSLDTTQELLTGYVNAAQWQDPQATAIILGMMALHSWLERRHQARHHRHRVTSAKPRHSALS